MKTKLLALVAFAAFVQCTSENSLEKYGESSCNTAVVSYSEDVAPILSAHCTSCHGNDITTADFNVEGYDYASSAALDGKLFNRMNRSLGDPMLMPPNGPLDSCSIALIKAWTDHGAPNN